MTGSTQRSAEALRAGGARTSVGIAGDPGIPRRLGATRRRGDGWRPSPLQFDDASGIGAAGATGLRLVAAAGTTIAGRVTLGPDAPLSDIPVNADRVGNDAESLHGTSGSDGRFILLGAKPGATYDVRTSLLGIVQGRARGVATGASDVHLR